MTDELPLCDEFGTPLLKQPPCRRCGLDEVGSHFGAAWCHRCGWRGTLSEVHALAIQKGASA